MSVQENRQIAKLENDLVLKAHYSLTAVEQKLVLHLASRLDPKNDEQFVKQVVPIKTIEQVLWGGQKTTKFGAVYEYLHEVCQRLLDRKITFPKGTVIKGEKIMGGGINWFQSILVTENEKKEASVEFMFSEKMKPFLLELQRYVSIDIMEVMGMKSTHSIRMYKVFRAERERTKKYKKVTQLTYDLGELKAQLGVGGKYKAIKDFRKYVLEPIKKEINEHSSEISVDYTCLKSGRRISGIQFEVFDKKGELTSIPLKEDYKPSEEEIQTLTWSKRRAYDELVKFGVKGGIAFKQLIPTIKGSEFLGFEDYFVNAALKHFKSWAKTKNAGVLVKWWHEKKVFDVNSDVWSKILEKVVAKKKKLETDDPQAFDNRQIAKEMSYAEFIAWHKAQGDS